jgi:hypothetical protein
VISNTFNDVLFEVPREELCVLIESGARTCLAQLCM